jgi:hypothetical protein
MRTAGDGNEAAVRALGRLGSDKDVRLLRIVLHRDGNGQIRSAAAEAIAAIESKVSQRGTGDSVSSPVGLLRRAFIPVVTAGGMSMFSLSGLGKAQAPASIPIGRPSAELIDFFGESGPLRLLLTAFNRRQDFKTLSQVTLARARTLFPELVVMIECTLAAPRS